MLLHFGLEGVKIHKIKNNRFVIQNSPLMQLGLIFHKTVNKNKIIS